MPPLSEPNKFLKSMESLRNGDMVSSTHKVGRPMGMVAPTVRNSNAIMLTLRTALYDYNAQGEDELSLRRGQIVEVIYIFITLILFTKHRSLYLWNTVNIYVLLLNIVNRTITNESTHVFLILKIEVPQKIYKHDRKILQFSILQIDPLK